MVYFPDNFVECDVLKVNFFPQKVAFPKVTNTEYLRQTAEDMLKLLQATKPATYQNPLSFGALVLNALGEVAKSLGRSVTNPSNLVPPDPFCILPLFQFRGCPLPLSHFQGCLFHKAISCNPISQLLCITFRHLMVPIRVT